MKKLWRKFKETFWTKKFLSYGIIGCVNTVNNFLFSSLYSSFLQPNLAFTAGYITSLLIGYFLNTHFTFKIKPSVVRCLKFCLSYVPNFLIQQVVVLVVYNGMGAHQLVAYAVAAVIGVPVTYLILRVFAFARKDEVVVEVDLKEETAVVVPQPTVPADVAPTVSASAKTNDNE